MYLPKKSFFMKLSLIAVLFAFTALGCKPTAQELAEVEEITLHYWQVWQNSFDMEALIEEYERLYPNVKIHFRNFRFEEYELEMLKALSEDRGPDIFSIPHDWIGLYRNRIAPQPDVANVQRIIKREPGPGEIDPVI